MLHIFLNIAQMNFRKHQRCPRGNRVPDTVEYGVPNVCQTPHVILACKDQVPIPIRRLAQGANRFGIEGSEVEDIVGVDAMRERSVVGDGSGSGSSSTPGRRRKLVSAIKRRPEPECSNSQAARENIASIDTGGELQPAPALGCRKVVHYHRHVVAIWEA